MSILAVSLTSAGQALADRLQYESHHGDLAETVRRRWSTADGFVLVCAVGIATRVVGPLLGDKTDDPAVVVVDQKGRWAIPLVGGHHGRAISANDLARDVAAALGAEAVITTATDSSGMVALDQLRGFKVSGDVAGVTRALLDAESVELFNPLGWPVPEALTAATTLSNNDPASSDAAYKVLITDHDILQTDGVAVLHPPSLVAGIGASSNAPADAGGEILRRILAEQQLSELSIATVATVDRRADDPVITSLGYPIRSFRPADLAPVSVPNPSDVVNDEIGTFSVAEAAALLASGADELVVEKVKGATATLAIGRRAQPEGSVTVVGLGPGHAKHRTPQAVAAIRHAETVIGYKFYVDQIDDLTSSSQTVVRSPIGAETERCVEAVQRAAKGEKVALVCSGDPGVFAMATLVLEQAPAAGNPPVEIMPGVTASLAASALLGAPLAHDHALVSLSDLLTPWPLIERRLEALASADMAVALYNPRSRKRIMQLERARDIMIAQRGPDACVGIVVNATRPGQQIIKTTLAKLDPAQVDMFSIVIIGSSTTSYINGAMVTPRGYDRKNQ